MRMPVETSGPLVISHWGYICKKSFGDPHPYMERARKTYKTPTPKNRAARLHLYTCHSTRTITKFFRDPPPNAPARYVPQFRMAATAAQPLAQAMKLRSSMLR